MSNTPNMGLVPMAQNPSRPDLLYTDMVAQVDNSLTRVLSKTITGNTTLSQAETQNYGAYKLTGSPGANFTFTLDTTTNVAKCSFGVWNTTAKDATIKSGSGANTVIVLAGTYAECRMMSVNDIMSAGAGGGGGGGGSGDLVKISTLAPAGNSATFTAIAGTYGSLLLLGFGRSATASAQTDSVRVQFNTDTGANYSKSRTLGYSGSTIVAQTSGDNDIRVCDWPSSTGIANYPGLLKITIPFYSNAVLRKGILWDSLGFEANTLADAGDFHGGGWWDNAAAITEVKVFLGSTDNFANAHFTLYGLNS